MIQIIIFCHDKYEAQKLASLIFIDKTKETYVTKILNVIENEIVLLIKDKSAHSVILKDNNQVLLFTDFIQSIIEKKHRITATKMTENSLKIIKEWTHTNDLSILVLTVSWTFKKYNLVVYGIFPKL